MAEWAVVPYRIGHTTTRTAESDLRRLSQRLGGTLVVLALLSVLTACSPEATRTRGDGPGADVGNRGPTVEIHGRTNPAQDTPPVGQAIRK